MKLNIIISTALIAWSFSQIAKLLIGAIKFEDLKEQRVKWRFIWAGGMPSSHSAFSSSVSFILLLKFGFNDLLFGLSVLITALVIYDRTRQNFIYKTILKKYPKLYDEYQKDPMLKNLIGHDLNEILVGILIGFATAILINIIVS